MDKIVVVGSGASGVHFALSLLRKGYQVTMLDVGYPKPIVINPSASFLDLKSSLGDPAEYFLGKNFEAVIYPDNNKEYYGFPPSKNYVLHEPPGFSSRSSGFAPLFSFAQGGLGEIWTGGVYPLNDDELSHFPFGYKDILPHYNEVAGRIGVSGEDDDLSRFIPFHDNISDSLSLDAHSKLILSRYAEKKAYLNKRLNCYLGRSRIATLSRDKDGRKACTYTGRCLWGCPSGALYTPSMTLEECRSYTNFTYIKDTYVTHFRFNAKRHVTAVIANSTKNGNRCEFPLDKLALAAGALSSSRIFLRSILENSGEIVKLHGLMDNRQALVPFVNFTMAGKSYTPEEYQYHHLAMGFDDSIPERYVHGQITTLKSALIHPLIQKIPFDLKTSIYIFKNFHSALGLINLNFHDSRCYENYLSLIDEKRSDPTLFIKYSPAPGESTHVSKTIKTLKRVLRKLGCIVPPGTVYVRPSGASVHYSGTIPMTQSHKEFTTSEFCQSNDFDNLFIVDGTTFPFLPAKNLTFTLMANAIRVAENIF